MTYRRLTSPGRSRRAERSRTSAPSIGRVRRGPRGGAGAEEEERRRDDDMEFTLAGAVGVAPPQQQADRPGDIGQRGDETGGDIAQPAEPLDDLRQEEAEPVLRDVDRHVDEAEGD